MQITFLGAAETVTGSKYLVEEGNQKILVDCGLFQGHKQLRLRNWEPFPIPPEKLDAVVLTHAHIDHSGYLPLLVKNGFRGKIYATGATRDLCEILLEDSGHLQEEDAKRANRYGYSKHKPAKPLYTEKDAKAVMRHFYVVDFDKTLKLNPSLTLRFRDAGHILGAATATLQTEDREVVFSGDLGRLHDPIMKPPAPIEHADYMILESTYGDRLHEKSDPKEEIEEIINSTFRKGGSVIIPSFAVGRAQLLLYYIHQLKEENRIPHMPVFLDSPMAQDATDLWCRYAKEHRLSSKECHEICATAEYVRTPKESKELHRTPMPKIIISASGMATGGRILHHLKHYMGQKQNSILFAGFQAGGTRGDRIVRGEKEIKIHGEMHQVRARVECLNSLSAHADYEEIFEWLSHLQTPPKKIFLVHGEPEGQKVFQERIKERLGWECEIPRYLQKIELT